MMMKPLFAAAEGPALPWLACAMSLEEADMALPESEVRVVARRVG